jgi:carbonic anhydrase
VASRVTQVTPGETFITRNPGSLLPNYNVLNPKTPRPEEAALELACLYNNIDTMVLAGHSDCKAMNLVYDNRHSLDKPKNSAEKESVLKSWLMSNSRPQIEKYFEAEKHSFKRPIKFNSD